MTNAEFKKMTLREFLENYKDFFIEFRVEDPNDEYNGDYNGLKEFEEGGYEFFLDDLILDDLTVIKIYPQYYQPRIKLIYNRL